MNINLDNIDTELFMEFLKTFNANYTDCEIIDVYVGGRKEIVFRVKEKGGIMIGRYCIKIILYVKFLRDYKIEELLK